MAETTYAMFPEWVDPSWHNSIIGCIFCQEICPQNKEFLEKVTDMGEFSDIMPVFTIMPQAEK